MVFHKIPKKTSPKRLRLKPVGGHSPGTTVPRRVVAHGSDERWKGGVGIQTTSTTSTTSTTTTV